MEIAESLIAAGASLDEKDGAYRRTALVYAAYMGRTETAKLLIAAGASLDDKDEDQKTALNWAIERGHT